jgi:type I restriction enzyme, S subunit
MKNKKPATTRQPDGKPALIPKLRFPEFRDTKRWDIKKVDELVDTVTPPKKLPTSSYAAKGKYPIIDQSQADICGWTDDHEALIQDGLPLIIFGDHTCVLKLVGRPFAQGADGIKVLAARSELRTSFLYQFLNYQPVVTEEYKRHYSILKEKLVFFPDPKTGEQQKIAECLSSVDELIAAQAQKLNALKTHKKGLMQQLFPSEGETQPRLRFPEFRNAGDWKEKTLNEVFSIFQGYAFSSNDSTADGVRWLKIAEVAIQVMNHDTPSFLPTTHKSRFANFSVREGDYVIALTRPILSGELKIAQIDSILDGALLNQRVGKIVTTNHAAFVYYLLQCSKLVNAIEKSISGNDPPNLSAQQIDEIKIHIPEASEQKRIADCLASFDNIIKAQTQRLTYLKSHKKGLLQQLFPSLQKIE